MLSRESDDLVKPFSDKVSQAFVNDVCACVIVFPSERFPYFVVAVIL